MDRHQIILFGEKNSGKTSTLMELVILLAGSTPAVVAGITAIFGLPSGKFKDGRFVVRYRPFDNNEDEFLIFVCTAGDSWYINRCNWLFFKLIFDPVMDIYEASPVGVTKLSQAQKSALLAGSEPNVCICPCSVGTQVALRDGAIQAHHYFSEKYIMDYASQLWVRKEESPNDPVAASAAMAVNLKGKIDDCIAGN